MTTREKKARTEQSEKSFKATMDGLSRIRDLAARVRKALNDSVLEPAGDDTDPAALRVVGKR